eukprot:894305-Prymnesium_polylepis.1
MLLDSAEQRLAAAEEKLQTSRLLALQLRDALAAFEATAGSAEQALKAARDECSALKAARDECSALKAARDECSDGPAAADLHAAPRPPAPAGLDAPRPSSEASGTPEDKLRVTAVVHTPSDHAAHVKTLRNGLRPRGLDIGDPLCLGWYNEAAPSHAVSGRA